MRVYSDFLLQLDPHSGIMQNSTNSLYSGITKMAGKTSVISRMYVTLKSQDYDCLTMTTLIYLEYLVKVRQMATSRCQKNQCWLEI